MTDHGGKDKDGVNEGKGNDHQDDEAELSERVEVAEEDRKQRQNRRPGTGIQRVCV